MTASDFPLRHHFREPKPGEDPRCVRCGILFSKVVPLDGHSFVQCAESRLVAISDHLAEKIGMAFSETSAMYGKVEVEIALGLLLNLSGVTAVEGKMGGEDFVRLADMAYEGMLRETKEDS